MAVLPFPFDPARIEQDELREIDEMRSALLDHGWQPVAVLTGDKRPEGFRWQSHRGALPPANQRAKNTGLLATGLRAIDVDIDDPDTAQTVVRMILDIIGDTPLIRFRESSARLMMIYRAPDGTEPVKAQQPIPGGKVEILGRGQQFVAYGQHPDGDIYEWRGPAPHAFPRDEVPELPADVEAKFIEALKWAFEIGERKSPSTPQKTAENRLPKPAERITPKTDFWRAINDAAFANLDAWVPAIFPTARYQPGTGAWRVSSRDLGRSRQEDLSIAPTGAIDFGEHDMGDPRAGKRSAVDLVIEWGGAPDAQAAAFWLCDRLGRPPEAFGWTDLERGGPDDAQYAERLLAGSRAKAEQQPSGDAPKPPLLPILDPTTLQGIPVPTRKWWAEDLVPAGTVTELSGDGGAGKSLLALQACVAAATGGVWLGMRIERGRALFLTAEDEPDEVHRRLWDILRAEQIEFAAMGLLRIAPLAGQDATLAAANARTGALTPTALWAALRAYMADWQPSLLVLDTRADLFGGNEVDRVQVRQFVTMLRNLAMEHGATIIMLAHPSVAGMNTGSGLSGSTAWNNSVRSRLYMRRAVESDGTEQDPDLRILTNKKANYGPAGGEIRMRWEEGRFVRTDDGEAPIDVATARERADALFLDLLAAYDRQGRNVNTSSGPNYAPAVFAADASARGVTREQFRDAMNRLLHSGQIRNIEFGPPSRRVMRLAIASEWDV